MLGYQFAALNLRPVFRSLLHGIEHRPATQHDVLQRVVCYVLAGAIYPGIVWAAGANAVVGIVACGVWSILWLGEIALIMWRDRSPLEGA